MFSRAIPSRNVLAGGFVIKWTSSNLLDLSQASLSEPGILQICRHKNSSQTESCRKFSDFISREIINRVSTGAFRVWREVGVDDPPYLVLPSFLPNQDFASMPDF